MSTGKKPKKARYFTFIVYPESAPPDWKEQLKALHAPFAISPLHDKVAKEIDDAVFAGTAVEDALKGVEEEDVKPHYHVIYRHSNTVSLEVVKDFIPAGIAANGHIEFVHHPRMMNRYLIHLDNPEKQQFSAGREAIDIIGTYPLDLTRDFTQEELQIQRSECLAYIRSERIFEYADLIDGLEEESFDLFTYAANHTIFFTKYLDSLRNSERERRYMSEI